MSQFHFSWPPADNWEALKKAVLKQVEFYLSPKNVGRDQRMFSRVLQHGNGFVLLSKIMRMQRMRSLPLTEDQVAQIIRWNSTTLKMSFNNQSVRRNPELPSWLPLQVPSNLRVLVKNFPIYATAEDISAFFKPVAEILLCHTYFDAETRNFVMNGTVTILFYCEITCEEFVAHPLVLYDKNRLSRYHVVLGQSLDRVFEPGSCVKVNATKGDFSRADVWLAARRSSHIAAIHVEYREGWKEAWIRFCTAEDAQEFAGMRTLKVRKEICELKVADYEEETALQVRIKEWTR